MNELLIILFMIIFMILIIFIPILLVDISFKIKDKLNHTIFKEKYKNKLVQSIEEGIKFNNYKINKYKGIEDETVLYDDFQKHCAICNCCDSEFYISEGIDKILVDEFKQSELEAHNLSIVYSEQKRKENLQARVKFIEEELKDIKNRI
jgi:hypothetical protein